MNLKQLSLAALASMALFACSNDESLRMLRLKAAIIQLP